MSNVSLKEVEKALTALWTKRETLDSFLDGDFTKLDENIAGELDANRILIYENTVHAGHKEAMDKIFPLCAELLAQGWRYVSDDYLQEHPPHHFRPSKMGGQFPAFVAQHVLPKYKKSFPYLVELADYEWTQMTISEMETEPVISELNKLETPEQYASYAPIINQTLALKNYTFPILKIVESLENGRRPPRNIEPAESHVLIYRDPIEHECYSMTTGCVGAAILEQAQKECVSYSALCQLAVSMNPDTDPQNTVADFLTLLEGLQSKFISLGHRRIN